MRRRGCGLDEQSIVRRGHPDRALAFGQEILDPFPLVVAQSKAPHRSALQQADPLWIEEFAAPEPPI